MTLAVRASCLPTAGSCSTCCAASALSARGDEAELSWEIVMPVLDGWWRDLAPLEESVAGSEGPSEM